MKQAYLIIISLIAIYFVIGGIANIIIISNIEQSEQAPEEPVLGPDGNMYRNILEQEASDDYEKMIFFYPVYDVLGNTLSYIVTLICFGLLGSVIRMIMVGMHSKEEFEKLSAFSMPVLGGLIGLLIVVISYVMPEFKYESGNHKAYYFLSLVSGIYSSEIFNWLKQKFLSMLHIDTKEGEKEGK